MILNCEIRPLDELGELCKVNRQSILIEGRQGSGKTYLSQQYANMLEIDDFISIAPRVSDIREALDSCVQLQSKVLLSIENLDLGVPAAAYTLLKSLEEPLPNVYIVITCRNLKGVPDTIISRSAIVSTVVPTLNDIDEYGRYKDELKYEMIKDRLAWRCTRSFTDADNVLSMTSDQLDYYESLAEVCRFNDNIANLVWTISHYSDNQPCNIELAIRSIMELMHNRFITSCGIDCLRELSTNRIAQHAVLAKFLFNAKYCE